MSLLAENTRRWNNMHSKPSFVGQAKKFAERAIKHKAEYEAIAADIKAQYALHVPWWFIPLVHERECVGGVDNWNCNIAQGSRYNQKSRIIPRNGPFPSFRAAAIAALVKEAPKAATNTNWSGGGAVTIAERYNGLGYAKRGLPSPYIWSGTDQYRRGKYVRDGKYDANVVDTQVGVAVSLRALMDLDSTIQLDGDLPKQAETDRTKEIVHTTAGSGGIAEAAHQGFINGVDDWMIYAGIAVALVALGFWVYRIYKKKKGEV